jgi:hypothetical protein
MLHPTTHDKWIQDLLHLELSDRAVRDREDATLEHNHQQQFELDQQHHAAVIAGAKDAHVAAVRELQQEAEALHRRKQIAALRAQHEADALKRTEELAVIEALEKEQEAILQHDRVVAEKKAKLREERETAERESLAREAAASAKAESAKPMLTPALSPSVTPVAQRAIILSTPALPPPPAQVQPPLVAGSSSSSGASPLLTWDQLRTEHDAYMKLHRHLKAMRKHMTAAYKQAQQSKKATGRAIPPIEEMADMRRKIKKSLGQLTQDGQKNKKIVSIGLDIGDFTTNT